jgi:hypothetical protein
MATGDDDGEEVRAWNIYGIDEGAVTTTTRRDRSSASIKRSA